MLILIYLFIINIIAFAAYGIDKNRAVRHRYRISEATLLILALIGGSVGALAGMYIFHHKTRKPKFRFGVPAILMLQIALFLLLGFAF